MIFQRENGWKDLETSSKDLIFKFAQDYKKFLDLGKTERECVEFSKKILKEHGFVDVDQVSSIGPGSKIYFSNRSKNIVAIVIGEEDLEKGIHFVVSHIDSPRLDLKPNPLYEDSDLALFKTHYYGGVKKYQWAAIPLALHGVVFLKNGEKVSIKIGEDEEDPVFTIPDLLPHLSKNAQDTRTSREVLKAEELNILVGSIPTDKKKDQNDKDISQKIKYLTLEKLKDLYQIEEEDFVSAEFEVVPAFKAKDIGFDRGLLAAYGQDDRVCAYTSLRAILDLSGTPKKTAVCFLADKEEIGSTGSTGLDSHFLEYFVSKLIHLVKGDSYREFFLKETLWNSRALSSDVTAGINPNFKSVHDEQNAAKLGYGVGLTKYTGSGGKGHSNDADAEIVSWVRNLFNENKIKWQSAMLGKVDEGGGGTVAMFLSRLGIKTIDIGPAVIGMHSPFEVVSKFDVYESYRAYKAFFESAK